MSVKRTIELSADVVAALAQVAEAGAQTPSQVIEHSLVSFLQDAAETADDAVRWERYLQTRKGVPIEAVRRWVESWNSDNELATPVP